MPRQNSFDKHWKAVFRRLCCGEPLRDICEDVGISRRTEQLWVKDAKKVVSYADVREIVMETTGKRVEAQEVEDLFTGLSKLDDWRATAWFLERSDPLRFGPADRQTLAKYAQMIKDLEDKLEVAERRILELEGGTRAENLENVVQLKQSVEDVKARVKAGG